MKTTVTRRIEWDSAHRVLRHESKCSTLHGHRYVALVTVSAPVLDFASRVVDFGVVKERVGGWVDKYWDHTTLVSSDDVELFNFAVREVELRGHKRPYVLFGEPTAEVIARTLFELAQQVLLETGVALEEVTVFETPNCSATVRAPERFSVRYRPPELSVPGLGAPIEDGVDGG